jgi:hypothetical protein
MNDPELKYYTHNWEDIPYQYQYKYAATYIDQEKISREYMI